MDPSESGASYRSETRSVGARAPSSLPCSVDLRPRLESWGLRPRRQGARGTCSVFTIVGALEFATAARTGMGARLSVEFLNWAAHRAVDRSEDGGFFSELWAGFERFGICSEDRLPYRESYDHDLEPGADALADAGARRSLGLCLTWLKEWDPNTGMTHDQLEAVKQSLAERIPVCGGFRWPKKPIWTDGVLQMCPPDEVYDGHSVLLVGYRDDAEQPGGGLFTIRNSGGDGSDGHLPYAYVTAYMNDAAVIRS